MLKSQTIDGDLPIFPFLSVSFCSSSFKALLSGTYIIKMFYIVTMNSLFYHYYIWGLRLSYSYLFSTYLIIFCLYHFPCPQDKTLDIHSLDDLLWLLVTICGWTVLKQEPHGWVRRWKRSAQLLVAGKWRVKGVPGELMPSDQPLIRPHLQMAYSWKNPLIRLVPARSDQLPKASPLNTWEFEGHSSSKP